MSSLVGFHNLVIHYVGYYCEYTAEEKERREQEKEKVRAAKKEEAINLDMNVRSTLVVFVFRRVYAIVICISNRNSKLKSKRGKKI